MKFADRMDIFQEGIFSKLAHLKEEKIKEGMHVIDLSVGTPNIPPAKHIVDALIKQAGNLESYLYPLNDKEDLRQAVKVWYKNRYGVDIDPDSEVTSLLGSQEGLAHIALSIVNPGDTVLVLILLSCFCRWAKTCRGKVILYATKRREWVYNRFRRDTRGYKARS